MTQRVPTEEELDAAARRVGKLLDYISVADTIASADYIRQQRKRWRKKWKDDEDEPR